MLAFATVGISAFGSVKSHLTRDQGRELLWRSAQIFSVGFSAGAAALVSYYVEGFLAWPLTGCLMTAIFYFSRWEPNLPLPTYGLTEHQSKARLERPDRLVLVKAVFEGFYNYRCRLDLRGNFSWTCGPG